PTPMTANQASVVPGGLAGVGASGFFSIPSAEADYGARTMLLAIRTLAKNLRAIPGRKMLILFSAGFPLTPERESELTAATKRTSPSIPWTRAALWRRAEARDSFPPRMALCAR